MDYSIRSLNTLTALDWSQVPRYPDAAQKFTRTELTVRGGHVLEYSPLQSAGRGKPPWARHEQKSIYYAKACAGHVLPPDSAQAGDWLARIGVARTTGGGENGDASAIANNIPQLRSSISSRSTTFTLRITYFLRA